LTKKDGKYSFVVTYSLKKGSKKFGKKGYDAAFGEMKQFHDCITFRPVNVNDLTPQERQHVLESLSFLVEKCDGKVKRHTSAKRSTQRGYINKEDAVSPTVATESIAITATINAKHGHDVMTIDVPNAFIQTDLENIDENRVIMKTCGPLVEMLVSLNPELESPFVTEEQGKPVLYVELLKALCGTLQAALLFYKK
jgi:hypothetical protein